MEEKQRIQLLADQLQSFLVIADSFVENLTDEDYELLEKAKSTLKANINIKHSAATLAAAFGIEQDTIDEEYKIKSLEAITALFNTRKSYRKALIEKVENDRKKAQNKQELMQALGFID